MQPNNSTIRPYLPITEAYAVFIHTARHTHRQAFDPVLVGLHPVGFTPDTGELLSNNSCVRYRRFVLKTDIDEFAFSDTMTLGSPSS